jgi:TonB family protein
MKIKRLASVYLVALLTILLMSTPAYTRSVEESAVKVVQAVPSLYPPIARAAHVSGEVKVEATIDADGAVTSVNVVNGHKLLSPSVEKATRKWKFNAVAGNTAVRSVVLTFQFTLIAANKGTPEDLGVIFWPPYKVEIRDTAYRVD